MDKMEQDLLVREAKMGNKEAFTELIKIYKVYLYKTAFLYIKDEEKALDVMQDCIIRSMVSIRKLKKTEYFKTWITRILINCAYSAFKEDKKHPAFMEELENIVQEEIGISIEEKLDLYHAVDKLEYPYKTIIIQKYFNDFRLEDIAHLLNMPIGTVKAYHSKAKKQLKIYLKEES